MTELIWHGTRVRVPDASAADYLARGFRKPEPKPVPKPRAKPKGR